MLLLSASPEDVYEAIVAGAVGYLMRGARAEGVCAAVEAVARGERVLAPDAQDGPDRLHPHPRGRGEGRAERA